MTLYRLTARGTLPSEEFNFGLHVDGPADDASGASSAFVTALTAFWQDITSGVEGFFSTDVTIVVASAAQLDPITGRQVDAFDTDVSLPGTSGSDMLPHEVAWVVSLLGAQRRRNLHGRMYLPPPAVNQITNGLILTASRDRCADAAAILINDLQGAGFNPVIKHPDMTFSTIAQVKVGNVPDAQRRRRNKLIETYSTVGV